MASFITGLVFTPSSRRAAVAGLLGWVRFRLGADWRVDGVAVRRTLGGELRLSFPTRVDGAGREHPFVLPACDRVRRELEVAVLAAIEEPLRPSPGRAHVEACGADEDAEKRGAHAGQGTAGERGP